MPSTFEGRSIHTVPSERTSIDRSSIKSHHERIQENLDAIASRVGPSSNMTFNPLPTSSGKCSKLRLDIYLDSDVYCAGTLLCGRVDLSCASSKKVLLGEIAVEITEALDKDMGSKAFLHKRTVFQGDRMPPSSAVRGQNKGGFYVANKARTHIVQFRYRDRSDTLLKAKDAKVVDRAPLPGPRSISDSNHKIFGWFSPEGKVELEAIIHQDVIGAGQKLPMSVTIQGMKVTLLKRLSLVKSADMSYSDETSNPGVQPDVQSIRNGALFEVNLYVNVCLNSGGMLKEVSVEIPIIVHHTASVPQRPQMPLAPKSPVSPATMSPQVTMQRPTVPISKTIGVPSPIMTQPKMDFSTSPIHPSPLQSPVHILLSSSPVVHPNYPQTSTPVHSVSKDSQRRSVSKEPSRKSTSKEMPRPPTMERYVSKERPTIERKQTEKQPLDRKTPTRQSMDQATAEKKSLVEKKTWERQTHVEKTMERLPLQEKRNLDRNLQSKPVPPPRKSLDQTKRNVAVEPPDKKPLPPIRFSSDAHKYDRIPVRKSADVVLLRHHAQVDYQMGSSVDDKRRKQRKPLPEIPPKQDYGIGYLMGMAYDAFGYAASLVQEDMDDDEKIKTIRNGKLDFNQDIFMYDEE
ncbi:hypothetical protein EDD86DRAFT_246756 [Gorgonomyces haynaldii]|nr:hypothetical protein EDD86DRAFT_246756 [Gorgonomyces haynaldii]